MRKALAFCVSAVLGAGTLAAGTAARAHHSYAAAFDVKERIELEGKVMQVTFGNPHSSLQLEAPDDKGVVQRWSVEWSGTAALTSRGIVSDTLKIGDVVRVTAMPSRVRSELRAKIVTLRRPSDGLKWGVREGEIVD
jgi:hypothetical protein